MLEVKAAAGSGPAREIPAEGVAIAEAARRTGLSVHTLRYYERAGLAVAPVDRTDSGRRRYRQLDLDWNVFCAKLRTTGMPIATIRRYAELVSAGQGNERERLALLEHHRAGVTARLDAIKENLRLVDHKIDAYRAASRPGTQISCGHRAWPRSDRAETQPSEMPAHCPVTASMSGTGAKGRSSKA